jgi:hypothetical protein
MLLTPPKSDLRSWKEKGSEWSNYHIHSPIGSNKPDITWKMAPPCRATIGRCWSIAHGAIRSNSLSMINLHHIYLDQNRYPTNRGEYEGREYSRADEGPLEWINQLKWPKKGPGDWDRTELYFDEEYIVYIISDFGLWSVLNSWKGAYRLLMWRSAFCRVCELRNNVRQTPICLPGVKNGFILGQ